MRLRIFIYQYLKIIGYSHKMDQINCLIRNETENIDRIRMIKIQFRCVMHKFSILKLEYLIISKKIRFHNQNTLFHYAVELISSCHPIFTIFCISDLFYIYFLIPSALLFNFKTKIIYESHTYFILAWHFCHSLLERQ